MKTVVSQLTGINEDLSAIRTEVRENRIEGGIRHE